MSDIKTGDTKVSEIKPKRATREPAQIPALHNPASHSPVPQSPASLGEAIVAEAVASVTAPIVERIERNVIPAPEPTSAIALAQAVPAGPACPVPAAAEHSPTENPAVSGKSPLGKSPLGKSPLDKSPDPAAETAWTAFAEAQAALARGFEKAAVEMTGISRSGVAATTDAAVALLGARTFAEALEINAALARRGIDTMFAASARMSEIGAKTVADASRPLLSRYARRWDSLGTS